MTPVETQSLLVPDVHSFTAPSAAANMIIPIATLIPERAFYISLMNMIIGPVRVHSYRNRGCYDCLPNNTGASAICCSGFAFTMGGVVHWYPVGENNRPIPNYRLTYPHLPLSLAPIRTATSPSAYPDVSSNCGLITI